MREKAKELLEKKSLKEAVSTLIKEIKDEKEKEIQELILEIDRLNREAEHKKDELKEKLNETFEILENLAEELEEDRKKELIDIIEENKLKTLEFLGILAETAEAAYITALEKNEKIEETIKEISKNLTFETIDANIDRIHIEDISKTILKVASDIAIATTNYSDEIIRGTVFGVKEGIEKSIEKFIESIEYIPIEARELVFENYENIIKDLENIDKIYIETIIDVANRSEAGIKEKFLESSKKLESVLYRLQNTAQKAITLFRVRFSDFTKEAQETTNLLKKRSEDAKRLGIKVFNIAKSAMDETLKEAKKIISKDRYEK